MTSNRIDIATNVVSIRLFFIFLFVCLLTYTNQAQNIVYRSIKNYTQIDNLPLITSRKIVKDQFGFLWIATQEGLIKYAKTNPINYSLKSSTKQHVILGADVSDIAISKINIIVALNVFGGISCINPQTGNVFKKIRFDSNVKLFGDGNFTKFEFVDSCVILASAKGRIISYNIFNDRFIQSDTLANYIIGSRVDLIKSIEGNVFLGMTNGTIAVIDKRLKILGLCHFNNNALGEIRCNSIDKVPYTTNFIIATSIGFKVIKNKDNHYFVNNEFDKKNLLIEKKLIYCAAIYNDKIYFCTDYGFYYADISTFNNIKKIEDLANTAKNFFSQSYQIFLTPSYAFVGSFNGFTEISIEASPFSSLKKNSSNFSLLEHCLDLEIYGDNLWITGNNGLLKYDMNIGNPTVYNVKNYFQHVLKLPDGHIMGCGSEGLVTLENNQFIKANIIFKELKNISGYLFATSAIYKDSLIFLGAEYNKGVFVWNIKLHILTALFDNALLNSIITNKIFIENSKVFLLGEKMVIIYDVITKQYNIHKLLDPENKQELSILMDMIIIKDKYWFATYGVGIVQTNNKFEVEKIVDNKSGITNLGLYKLFNIGDSTIITSSNNGLFTFSIKSNKVKSYFEIDGLHGNIFEEFCGSQTINKIVMGGLNGITFINPLLLKENFIPPILYFQQINIETDKKQIDTSNVNIENLDIPNSYIQTKISFIGLNNQKEERVNYWYRIKELGNNWIDNKNQNFITLIGIPPGHYTLEVKAANEDGVECKPISMQLHFLPKWYQTLLFKIVIGLLIALGLFILYKFRIRQLKKIYTVRQKISGDLHDDIGSTLSSINMYSQIAQLGDGNNMQYINTIQENAREVQEKLDDIVWATNPKNDKIKNLVERIDGFARPLLQAKNIQFTISDTYTIANHPINEAARQCLFLICKEAINNSVKYAQCKSCSISIYIKQKNIHCQIKDDGMGFDTNKTTERNGLLNMQLRAKSLKGKFEITSEINVGTTISVVLPV